MARLGFFVCLIILMFNSFADADIARCITKTCRTVNDFVAILPSYEANADRSECPADNLPAGIYRKSQLEVDPQSSLVWQFNKEISFSACRGAEVYLTSNGETLLILQDKEVVLYKDGDKIKEIGYKDVNIKMTDPGNLAIDDLPSYDGFMTVSRSDANGFEISNGKGEIFAYDWQGVVQNR